jgi:hypothetical protein
LFGKGMILFQDSGREQDIRCQWIPGRSFVKQIISKIFLSIYLQIDEDTYNTTLIINEVDVNKFQNDYAVVARSSYGSSLARIILKEGSTGKPLSEYLLRPQIDLQLVGQPTRSNLDTATCGSVRAYGSRGIRIVFF